MKKAIIICIILILFSEIVLIQKNSNKEETKDSIVVEDEAKDSVEIEIIQEDDISQWALSNSGEVFFSNQFSNEWEEDNRIAQKGIDINYLKRKLEINRKVTIAIIDTGIDLSQINDTNLWKNYDEIPNDGIDNDCNGFIDDYYGWNFCDNNSKITDEHLDDNIHGTHIAGILSAKSIKQY